MLRPNTFPYLLKKYEKINAKAKQTKDHAEVDHDPNPAIGSKSRLF